MVTEWGDQASLGGSWRRRRLMRDCAKQNLAPCCANCLQALIRHGKPCHLPHRGRLGLFAHGTAGDRRRPTVCTQFPSFRRGDHRSPAVAFRYLSLSRRSAQDVFRFRSRNRRCSADEEKLRETQSVSYSYPPSGGALDSAVQIPAFLAFPSGGRWRAYLAG